MGGSEKEGEFEVAGKGVRGEMGGGGGGGGGQRERKGGISVNG